jgi:hypothetical protein
MRACSSSSPHGLRPRPSGRHASDRPTTERRPPRRGLPLSGTGCSPAGARRSGRRRSRRRGRRTPCHPRRRVWRTSRSSPRPAGRGTTHQGTPRRGCGLGHDQEAEDGVFGHSTKYAPSTAAIAPLAPSTGVTASSTFLPKTARNTMLPRMLVENPHDEVRRDDRDVDELECASADAVRQRDHLASALPAVERWVFTSWLTSSVCLDRLSSSSFCCRYCSPRP